MTFGSPIVVLTKFEGKHGRATKLDLPIMSTMFGALNRFISRLDSEVPSQNSRDRAEFGFQVLRNKNLEIPIEPWYDFVVGINGRQVVCPPLPII